MDIYFVSSPRKENWVQRRVRLFN